MPAPPAPPAARVPPRPTTVPSALLVVASEPEPLLPPAPAISLLSPPAPPPPPTASSSVAVGLVSNTNDPPPPHPPVGSGPPAPPGAPPPPKSPPGYGDVPWRIERFSPENTGTVATIWPPAPPRPPAADDPPEPPAMVTVIVETPAGTFHCWVVPAVPKSTVHVVASHDGVGSAEAFAGWTTPIASTLSAAVMTITASAPRPVRWRRVTTCTGGLPRTAAKCGLPEVANTLRRSGEETVDAGLVGAGVGRTRHE